MNKKLLVFGVILILCIQNITAQAHKRGDINTNAGVGIGLMAFGFPALIVPPLSVSTDYGISDKISVGAWGGYASLRYEATSSSASSYYVFHNYTILGLRGDYHFKTRNDKLDIYGGMNIGYGVVSVNKKALTNVADTTSYNTPVLGVRIGGRYYLNKFLGLFAELGYGFASTRFGLNIKL